MASCECLLKEPIWDPKRYPATFPSPQRLQVSYERAQSIARHFKLTVEDVVKLTPKFWSVKRDFITLADSAAATLFAIHWNLVIGTIAGCCPGREDLAPILAELENCEVFGEFMLTELGHGLDARSIETTATLNREDGTFDLHTPNFMASKAMPPTTLEVEVPRIAIVIAQLVVDGQVVGPRPFLVDVSDGQSLAYGINSRTLPVRTGSKEVDHAITSFDHVRLEPNSLLGDINEVVDPRTAFYRCVQRVPMGTLSLSSACVPLLKLSGYIVGKYSQRRLVTGPQKTQVPIIGFATQHTPILTSLSFAWVFESFSHAISSLFTSFRSEPEVQAAFACIFKQTATYWTPTLMNELIDRCGWQGLFGHNQLTELASAMKGNSIAEGDILVLCIRLASELLLGRYEVPTAQDPSCLLAKREIGVWKEASEVLKGIHARGGHHRDEEFNALLLPRCRSLIQAIGERVAYEATAAYIDTLQEPRKTMFAHVLRLFEWTCVLNDPSYFIQYEGFSRARIFEKHSQAVVALLPYLDTMLQETKAEPWAIAPILSEDRLKEFVEGLPLVSSPHEESSASGNSDLGGKPMSRWDLARIWQSLHRGTTKATSWWQPLRPDL